MLYCGLCWLQTVIATHPWGRSGSAWGKPVGDTFLPQLPLAFLHACSTHSVPVLSKGLLPLFVGQNQSVPVCPEGCHQRELIPSDLFRCLLPFSDWVINCHVSSGCCGLCMTYDWVWLSLSYYYFFQLCQAQALPSISFPTLWHALLRYFWGRGQMRCVPQIVLVLQWNGDGPEITCTSYHLHQIVLQRNLAAASDPF